VALIVACVGGMSAHAGEYGPALVWFVVSGLLLTGVIIVAQEDTQRDP